MAARSKKNKSSSSGKRKLKDVSAAAEASRDPLGDGFEQLRAHVGEKFDQLRVQVREDFQQLGAEIEELGGQERR
jgi:hypothetical protein